MGPSDLADCIAAAVTRDVAGSGTITSYRQPLIGFAAADDSRFPDLRRVSGLPHRTPQEMLPGARSVVSFFVPFDHNLIEACRRHPTMVTRDWAVAYIETNDLIGHITTGLIAMLGQQGIRAAAEPATGTFDTDNLVSRWSHKSVAVIVGLGTFGLHHLVITNAGSAGRFGSLVTDAELPAAGPEPQDRCNRCMECVSLCPVAALDEGGNLDRQRCWHQCLKTGEQYRHLGPATCCGKCCLGDCALESAV